MQEIYLDNSATTKICPEALEVYVNVSQENYGNPSSRHRRGMMAEQAMKKARAQLLKALGTKEGQIIFTAGGTEANNLAILGRAHAKDRFLGGRLITTAGEHSSVYDTFLALEHEGFHVDSVSTIGGVLNLFALKKMLDKRVMLVSMMGVNNETGALYDIKTAADLVHRVCPEGLVHVDATQSFMKIPFTPKSLGADMITLSSHKIEGPKGMGALWVSDSVIRSHGLSTLIHGGGQELGLLSGTENVPGAAAFGEAASVYAAHFAERTARMWELKNYLLQKLSSDPVLSEQVVPNLPKIAAAPHILSLTVSGMKSETVLNDLSGQGIYVSSGSACSTHNNHLSTALLAFGKAPEEADSTIRISLSFRNTEEELDIFLEALRQICLTRAKKTR